MKRRNNRKKRRGIKALLCFLLAAELMLGQLGTSAQAGEMEITDSVEEDTDAPVNEIEEETPEGEGGVETPDVPGGGEGGVETPDVPGGGEGGVETPDVPGGGEGGVETSDVPEGGEGGVETPDVPEGGEGGVETPDVPGGGENSGEIPDVPDEGENKDENPEIPMECICEILCTEDSVNGECPICQEDYTQCACEAEIPMECTCEILCTEDNVNMECPVCAGDYLQCSGEGKTEAVKAVPLQRRVREVGDQFEFGFFIYEISSIEPNEVIVKKTTNYMMESCTISKEVCDYEGRPYSIVGIGELAFLNCRSLKSVEIAESVTRIDDYAFSNCSALQSIKIPYGVTEISKYTFEKCSSLESVEIPKSVTTIGEGAFWLCKSLKSVEIPISVKKIDTIAFSECGLQSVKLPKGITEIANYVFGGCRSLESVEIPESVTMIDKQAFQDCDALKMVELPKGVTRIGGSAFNSCELLESVEIPEGCTTIDELAFAYCSSLKTIKLPEGITEIANSVFYGCSALEEIEIPESVTRFSQSSFARCSSLATLKIDVKIENGTVVPIQADSSAFDMCFEGEIIFMTPDGSAVYPDEGLDGGPTLLEVCVAYDKKDSKANAKWYIWKLAYGNEPEEPEEPEPTYIVTLNVKLNDTLWTNCNKSYALKKLEIGSDYTQDFNHVKDGKYQIFECIYQWTTGKTKYVDTGKQVEVDGKKPDPVTLEYYTVAAAAGVGGSVSPLGGTDVLKGSGSPVYTISANRGYSIESLLVNDTPVKDAEGKTSYSYITWVNEPTIIRVFFTEGGTGDRHELKVGIRKDDHEWLNNEKKLFVRKKGTSNYIELRYQYGEHIISLTQGTYRICVSLRPLYEFDPADYPQYIDDTGIDVTVSDADQTLYLDYYTANLMEGDRVTLPEGPVYVRKGSSNFFEIKPDPDCVLYSVKLDGEEIDEERFTKTREDRGFTLLPEETGEIHRIEVNCKPANVDVWIQRNYALWEDYDKNFMIKREGTAEAFKNYSWEEGGKIRAYLEAGKYTVYEFDEKDAMLKNTGVTFEADDKYQIVKVDYFTVTASTEKGGTIDPSGEMTVLKGEDCKFRLQADEGSALKRLMVNLVDVSKDVGEDGVYHLKDIQGKTEVVAFFDGGDAEDEYDVTITVNKDNLPWGTGNDKAYAFKEKDGENYTESFAVDENGKFTAKLKSGTYEIYEIEETAARALAYHDTKVSVEVGAETGDGAAEAAVDYYTVTFYDGKDAYREGTDQCPQIVLKNESVSQPSAPNKSGHSFDGWKTTAGGNTAFDFEKTTVTAATGIYASWTTGERPVYTITASAGEGGSISASGAVKVTEGASHTFHITANDGYKIKYVLVDDVDQGAVDSYCFTDVTGDHTIKVTFEKTGMGGGGETDPDKPGGGGGETDPDKPGGGGETDPDKPGGGGGETDPDKPGGGGGGETDPDKPGGGTGSGGSGGSGTGSGGSGGSGGSDTGGSAPGKDGVIVYTDGNIVSMSGITEEKGNAALNGRNVINGGVIATKGTVDKNAVTGAASTSETDSASGSNASRPGEPRTGDAFHYEIYATIAMIAGIVYLILYLLDGVRSMTEEEKERLIAALLRWAKQGRAKTLRRYIAIMAIFFVLVYYHALGKSADMEARTA